MRSMRTIATLAASLILTGIYGVIASREYTWGGAAAVFLMLTALSLPILLVARFCLSVSLAVAAGAILIDIVDRLKFRELHQHIQIDDGLLILGFLRELNFSFFTQYSAIVMPLALLLLAIGAVIGLVAWAESKLPSPPLRLSMAVALFVPLLAAAAVFSFMESSYMAAVKSQIPPRVAADRAPLRLSATLAGLSERMALSAMLKRDRAQHPRVAEDGQEASCRECPDIIIIHLESVYDPQFEESYSGSPSFAESLGNGLDKWNSLVRVNTWGGNSVVTEFEVLCSVNHDLFGWGGMHPHVNIAPHISGCLGEELRKLGYRTSALFPLNGNYANIRSALHHYGIEDVRDSEALQLPKKWSELRDHLLYAHLYRALAQTRDAPRFFWVSTNWNHGPHGLDSVQERFPGPYDATQARTPALADYMNRLNDSIAALHELERVVREADYPIAVLLYGDHQPAFRKEFSAETLKTYADPDYLTPIVMLRNFGGGEMPQENVIGVEEAAYYLGHFAGLPPLRNIKRIHDIQRSCNGDQKGCSEASQSALRAIQLR